MVWLAEHAISMGSKQVRVGRLPFQGKNQVVYTVPADRESLREQSTPSGGCIGSGSRSSTRCCSRGSNCGGGGGGGPTKRGGSSSKRPAGADASPRRKVSKVEL